MSDHEMINLDEMGSLKTSMESLQETLLNLSLIHICGNRKNLTEVRRDINGNICCTCSSYTGSGAGAEKYDSGEKSRKISSVRL